MPLDRRRPAIVPRQSPTNDPRNATTTRDLADPSSSLVTQTITQTSSSPPSTSTPTSSDVTSSTSSSSDRDTSPSSSNPPSTTTSFSLSASVNLTSVLSDASTSLSLTAAPNSSVLLITPTSSTPGASFTTFTSAIVTDVNGTPTTAPVAIVTALNTGDSGNSLTGSKRTGVIAGAAVGGTAFLLLLFSIFFVYRRRLDKKRYDFLKRDPPPRAAFLADELDDGLPTSGSGGYTDDPFAPPQQFELPPRLLRARASDSGSVFTEQVWPPPQNTLQDPLTSTGDLGSVVEDVMGPATPPTQHRPYPPGTGTTPPRLRGGSGDDASLYSQDSFLPGDGYAQQQQRQHQSNHQRHMSDTSESGLLDSRYNPSPLGMLKLTNPDAMSEVSLPHSPKLWLDRPVRRSHDGPMET